MYSNLDIIEEKIDDLEAQQLKQSNETHRRKKRHFEKLNQHHRPEIQHQPVYYT